MGGHESIRALLDFHGAGCCSTAFASAPELGIQSVLTERPITERILRWLGRPRWLWITAWALVPLASALIFGMAIRASGTEFGPQELLDLLASQAVLAFACFIMLVGCGLLAAQAQALKGELAQLAPDETVTDLFKGVGSVRGPLLLTGVVVTIVSASGWARYGPLPPLAALPVLIVYIVPIMTFVWTYLVVLGEINQVGGRRMALDLYPQDRTLGLDGIGSLASTGLALVLFAAVPVMLSASDNLTTLGISLAIIALAIGVFVLSMWRVHRQMVAAKARYLAIARRLYAGAYEPVRQTGSVDTLAAQSSALSAAQSLEARAHELPTWPIDEGTLKFMVVVITGVVTSLIVRGLFAALGF
jgi:hypothetical protein